MNPSIEKEYALDFGSVIRYVATRMEMARSEDRAISVEAMADGYRHPVSGDLSRVRRHHELDSDQAAIRFLVEQAIDSLDFRVETVDGGYRLTKELAGMKYPPDSGLKGRRIVPTAPDPHARFGAPFDPMSGRFSDNIRSTARDTMEELRESMRAFGWIEQLPAIKDERGVVIAGHRRLTVAAELGIEPNVTTVRFGDGDGADAARLRIAIGSNLGTKPLTPSDRAQLAAYLYNDREWSQERVAEALNVDQATVSRDLRNMQVHKSTKRGRPPKSVPTLSPERGLSLTSEQEETAMQMLEDGKNKWEVAHAIGTSDMPVRRLIERVRGRTEGREEAIANLTCPNCGHHFSAMPTPEKEE
jgi:DNA-binding MarR family transcriptional regulator